MAHLPWLRVANPTAMSATKPHTLPEDDIVWKTLRIRGHSVILAFAYFQCGCGFEGSNAFILHTIARLTDHGRKNLILAADFNMSPDDWSEGGWLEALQLTVITPPGQGTCRIESGYSMLDYLLVSKDIAALIHDVATVSDAPWSPHLGISFRINARPHAVRTMQLQRPSSLLPARNVDGKICSWAVPFGTWESAKREVAGTGGKAVTEMLRKMPDIKSYIGDLGIEAQTTRLAARYYEWSRAAECSIIAATGTDNDKRLAAAGSNRVLGRGCLPHYRLQSIALPLAGR